ncbi:MAG: hypothetical protein DRJ38_05455 [Thermoprotei archaeon]|nr:MAG: hypothetical protein DRJ38_05455 [Thermoprotei archaeon]
MVKITVQKVHGSPELIIMDMKKKWLRFQQEFIKVGKLTLNEMVGEIQGKSKGKHSKPEMFLSLEKNLANFSFFDMPSINNKVIRFGIGEKASLNDVIPHWYWINYGISQKGATVPGRGKFVPGYWEGDTFVYKPYSGKGMIPSKGISPVNYIEAGDTFFGIQVHRVINKLRR